MFLEIIMQLALLKELGNPSYKVREATQGYITQRTESYEVALRFVHHFHTDAEIRNRAEEILTSYAYIDNINSMSNLHSPLYKLNLDFKPLMELADTIKTKYNYELQSFFNDLVIKYWIPKNFVIIYHCLMPNQIDKPNKIMEEINIRHKDAVINL